jgi:hypothetical protein
MPAPIQTNPADCLSVAEPTSFELAAIEAEWPLIEAELGVLDAEIRMLAAVGGPSPMDWRRLRRAERRLLTAALCLAVPSADEQAGVAS